MENYIVRIYRRDRDNPGQVTGILESVEQETRQTFHTLDTLHSFLVDAPATPAFAETSQDNTTNTASGTVGLND